MPLRSRPFVALLLSTLPFAALLPTEPASGQSSDNGIADTGLQILQGLTPEQRDAIGQQFGGGLGATGGTGTQNALGRERGIDQQNQLQQQREPLIDMDTQRAELQRLSPYLQPEDWIVITIDSNPLPPPQPSPGVPQYGLPGNALQAGGAQAGAAGLGGIGGLAATQQGATNNAQLGAVGGAVVGATGTGVNTTNLSGAGATAGGYTPPPPPGSQPSTAESTEQPRVELTDEQKAQRDTLIDLIRSKNPYQLTRDGAVLLPGFAPIPMAGLTEQLATLRLGVEPALRNLFIRIIKLPLKKQGPTSLKPFGYDLFDRQISTFAPSTNVPVPADYVVGAGDELEVQLYGSKNTTLRLTVGRDGRVSFPQLGPISVAGQTFNAVKAGIEARVEHQMIGVRASVSMGDTRTIRVFVLGDAKRPGSYTISGLGTISSALFAAGGVQPIGSLRTIQLKRQGTLVRQLDLYDMLIRGDTTDDAKLLPGDVIFIPPIGPTVTVDGEVHRPAIYEIRNESTVKDVVRLAGGLTPEADTVKAALTRIDDARHRIVLQVDVSSAASASESVRNGDMLRVSRLRPTLDAGIVVDGYVYTTGAFAYHDGMRLTDVIRSVDELKPNADLHYILIRRELPPDRRITVLSADLEAALRAPGSPADLQLSARDHLTVFDLQSSRDRVIQPLIDDLKLQSNIGRPDAVVRIEGRANVPGEYPLEVGMTVRDLVRAGGGLSDAAYGGQAELTRYIVVNGESRSTELIPIDLAAALRGDPAANQQLEPFDSLSIKEVQAWTDREEVVLRGEVKFPGRYSIKKGETLRSVLLRAGGVTTFAYPEGSVFTRKDLRDREQKQLDLLAVRMQSDVTFLALEGVAANQSGASNALSVGQQLLLQLHQARAVGRLVINVPALMREPTGSQYDVVLRRDDQLIVPKLLQEVTVIGEVQTATSHLYRPGLLRNDYIALSGGETRRADKGRTYVVRADGSVVASSARWFMGNQDIRPGDTIVVPLNAEHMPPLPLWQAVSQILYNVAIAVLAVHEF
jgi:polysaccharide export outer membrane protein